MSSLLLMTSDEKTSADILADVFETLEQHASSVNSDHDGSSKSKRSHKTKKHGKSRKDKKDRKRDNESCSSSKKHKKQKSKKSKKSKRSRNKKTEDNSEGNDVKYGNSETPQMLELGKVTFECEGVEQTDNTLSNLNKQVTVKQEPMESEKRIIIVASQMDDEKPKVNAAMYGPMIDANHLTHGAVASSGLKSNFLILYYKYIICPHYHIVCLIQDS